METEIWKDINGYEGLYQISNLGNIKNLNYRKIGKEKILKSLLKNNGYYYINLYKYGIMKSFITHRLVALVFIPNSENKLQVNHIDGNKLNNNFENLEWCTRSENIQHCYKILGYKNTFQTNHPNLGKFGKDNPLSKKVNQYNKYGEFIKTRGSIIDITKELKINHSNVSACCKGKIKTAGKFIWEYF